jgi:hypothetical protein
MIVEFCARLLGIQPRQGQAEQRDVIAFLRALRGTLPGSVSNLAESTRPKRLLGQIPTNQRIYQKSH